MGRRIASNRINHENNNKKLKTLINIAITKIDGQKGANYILEEKIIMHMYVRTFVHSTIAAGGKWNITSLDEYTLSNMPVHDNFQVELHPYKVHPVKHT